MFGKKKEEEPEIIIQEAPKKPNDMTIIGQGIEMIGNFETSDHVQIDGTVRGNIISSTDIKITESGNLYGNAKTTVFDVSGNVDGEIICSVNATFASSGKMTGTLTTPRLHTAEGSGFSGKLNIVTEAAARDTKIAESTEE